MTDCKVSQTPMDPKTQLPKPEQRNKGIMKQYPYQNLIGALMYLAVSTYQQYHINAYTVNYLSQSNNNYSREDWDAGKRVLRYLKGTRNYRLMYRRTNEPLHGVADAD